MDLSKATGLKRVVLVCRSADPKWITVTLRSITDDHKHLQQIILDASCMFDILDILWPDCVTPAGVRLEIGKPAYREWMKLDRFLCRLLGSRSIQLKVRYEVPAPFSKREAKRCIKSLLPKVMKGTSS